MHPDLAPALAAAASLARRLAHSADEVRTLLPVTGTELAYMPERFRTEADALFHRFLTLHSLLCRRILPAALEAKGAPAAQDMAVRLAGAGLVPDADTFRSLSGLRDRLCDGYPVDPQAEAELLNACALAVPVLRALLSQAAAALQPVP